MANGLWLNVDILGGSSHLVSGFITMVIVSPLSRDIPLPNGLNGLLMGVTNQLLSGMILQVWCVLYHG